MATNKDGSLIGQYRGIIGPMQVTTWKGIPVVKSRPKHSSKRKRKLRGSTQQTAFFKKVNYLLRPLRDLFTLSFPEPAKAKMTPYNAALSVNMLKQIVDVDGRKLIDYTSIILSKCKNPTQQLWNAEVKVLPGRVCALSWQLNPFPQRCTRTDDLLKIMYCSNADPKFNLIHGKIRRSELSKNFQVSSKLMGETIFIYIVVISDDQKRVSVTDYLGMFTILP